VFIETPVNLMPDPKHIQMIGLLKNKYTVVKGQLPVQLLKHTDNSDAAIIDKTLFVVHLPI